MPYKEITFMFFQHTDPSFLVFILELYFVFANP